MTRKLCLIGILAFFAIFANAAVTITPQSPAIMDDGCYFITDRESLYGFAAIVNGTGDKAPDLYACARLGTNIVVNEGVLTVDGYLKEADTANFAVWTPIMNFRGTFDGQGFTISGLYFNDGTRSNVGLFGSVIAEAGGSAATIKNVAVSKSYLRGVANVGAIVGWLNGGTLVTVSNTLNNSRIETAATVAGGLVGLATGYIRLEQCVNWGYVGGKKQIGGIVGVMTGNDVAITNAYSKGVVESTSETANVTFAGGIVGQAGGNVALKNVYNRGYVIGDNGKGGIAGSLSGNSVVLVNAYNAGPVWSLEDGAENSGAIVGLIQGREDNFKYANVYYEISDGYGDAYGVGLPKTMMQDGTLAYLLHNYRYDGLDATVWGQDVENSLYPDFSGEISGATGLDLGSVILHTGVDDETLNLTYAPGYVFNLPVLAYEGYDFQGWYKDVEFDGEPVRAFLSTSSDQQEYWAKIGKIWSIYYWTGTTPTDFGEEVPTYVEGVGVTLPKTITQSGVVFNGWYDNKNFDGDRYYEIGPEATGDKLLYARWLLKKQPAKGDDGCYIIRNASELYGFAAIVNGTDGFTKNNSACAYLGDDIVVNENVLMADGSVNVKDSADFMKWTPMEEFTGKFDGRGHTISGLYYHVESGIDLNLKGVGLFGVVRDGTEDSPVVIKNVGIEDSYFGGVFNVGALVGHVYRRYNYRNIYVNISNVYNNSTVMSHENGGGLVGTISEYGNVVFENCYNTGLVSAMRGDAGGLVGATWMQSNVEARNSYYLKATGDDEPYGVATSMEQFGSGSVAYALHNGVNGSVWGQNVGTDPLPNFSGVVENFTLPSSSSETSSSSVVSSSSVSSSSSAKSSSSVVSSSSKANPVSSSSKIVLSSSAKFSSSSAKAMSSSSRGYRFIPLAQPLAPQDLQFSVSVVGLKVLLTGAKVGSLYALFDLQGRTILSGRAGSSDFTISVPYAGSYLLQVGYQTVRISVR